jgi:hypothetical protein
MPVIAPSAYPLIPTDSFSVEYAHVLTRPYVAGENANLWVDIGEVDYVKNTVTPTVKDHWSKSLPISQKTFSAATRIESKLSLKAFQKIDLLRAWSLMGSKVPFTQAAVANGSLAVVLVVAGGIVDLGVINGTVTGINLAAGAGATPVAATDWEVVDNALTSIRFTDDAVCAGAAVVIEFTAPAVTSYEITAATQPIIDVQLRCRGVTSIGKLGALDVLRWRVVPKGDQDYVTSNDDFGGYEFEGSALVVPYTTRSGILVNAAAIWTPLDA